MARLNKRDLVDRIEKAVVESGWNVLYLSSADVHPFHLQIYRNSESYRSQVYVWNITHGGGKARPQDEYRIQITGVDHFDQVVGEKTLVLGWWAEAEIFAGFDARKHWGILGSSPSFQIREQCLRDAYLYGFSPCDKGNQEIAIAFRPDFFADYVRNLEALHSFGDLAQDLETLGAVSRNPEINDEDIQVVDEQRKQVVRSIRNSLRDSSFRRRVLNAYAYRCAVCGIQLDLVVAAHIVPVVEPGSTDETSNGLALCVLHHEAYDQGLITVAEDYSVLLSESRVRYLAQTRRIDGLDWFREHLRPIIHLPPGIADRPHIEYIRRANQIRGWDV